MDFTLYNCKIIELFNNKNTLHKLYKKQITQETITKNTDVLNKSYKD